MSPPRLVVLGSLNIDLVVRAPHLPQPGETILGSEFATSQGGKGANQAIAAARAGADVTMIGAVGSDGFGDQLVATLTSEGVRTELLRRVQGPSGIAMITVDDGAENTIVVAAGANGLLTGITPRDERAITASDMLLLQFEVPIETVTASAKVAAAAGVPVLLNPSPAQPIPADLLAALTILVVNLGEAAALGEAVLATVPHLVTTLGSAGARYRGPAGVTATAHPPEVIAVDSTGAGDAFTGAFAVAWIEGADPGRALRWASAAGALATTEAGAGASTPKRSKIDRAAGVTATSPHEA